MAEEFTCAVDEIYRSACKDLPKYSGSRYCVLHEPDEAKDKEDFLKVKESKLDRKDYGFGGAVFPEGTSDFFEVQFAAPANFNGATFVGKANFSTAHFSGEGETDFRNAQFSGEVNFYLAQFSGERTDFSGAQFSGGASFQGAQFGEATDFSYAQFGGATNFQGAQFSGLETSFRAAQFSGERIGFTGAPFSVDFSGAQFSGETTDFSYAHFSGLANFAQVQFSGEVTGFSGAQFSGDTDFSYAHFSGLASFLRAQFSGEVTNFAQAQFSSEWTSFGEAQFSGELTSFDGATFEEKIFFWGSQGHLLFGSEAWAEFSSIRIETELLIFNTVLLHPGWFINTNMRKVDFTDVKWYGMPGGIPEGTLHKEIGALKKRRVESPYTLLAQACRRLSANAEENREYSLANEFHYWSMDALRKESWDYRKESWDGLVWIRRNWRRVAKRCGLATTLRLVWGRINRRRLSRPRSVGLIPTLYWALSGYGVRARRAFLVLLGIWAAFTLLYLLVPSSPFSGFSVSDVGEATVYSLGAIARLNPEPKPDPGWFQFLVTLEGLLGPLQIGLLLLAIRRKVMR